MPNPDPFRARQSKRQRGKPLDLSEVLAILSDALRKAEELLQGADDKDFILRCVHCVSQSAGQYSRLVSEDELESRLKVL
jgi:hypothetical protein